MAFYLPGKLGHLLATVIFMIAAITDWVDGYLARSFNQATKLGEFLDPVADKLVVAVALILVVAELGTSYVAVPATIIICREIAVSALREWMAELGKRASVAVSFISKIKTTLQMTSIAMLLYYCPRCGDRSGYLISGLILLYLAAGMTLWTMYLYLKASWQYLTSEDQI